MNSITLLYWLIASISIVHATIFVFRTMGFLKLVSSTAQNTFLDKKIFISESMKIGLTFILCFFPLILVYLIRGVIGNNPYLIILFLVSIGSFNYYALWFSNRKLQVKTSFLKNCKDPITKAIKRKDKKFTSKSHTAYKKRNIIKSNFILFQEVIENLENFKFWNKDILEFDLAWFKNIDDKPLAYNHAWFILIICFHDEILKTHVYTNRLNSRYYTFINEHFRDKTAINKVNWSDFRKNFVDNGRLESLQNSEFYAEIQKFIKKLALK